MKKKKTLRRPTPSSSFLAAAIVLLSVAILMALLTSLGFIDVNDAKKTYADYDAREYTFSRFEEEEVDDGDPNYYLYVKEREDALFISNLLYDEEMTAAFSRLKVGTVLSAYTDGEEYVVELAAEGTTFFSLAEYNEALRVNGITMIGVFSALSGILLILAIVFFALRGKRTAKEREIERRYHIRSVPSNRGRAPITDEKIMSKGAFFALTIGFIALFALGFVLVIVGAYLDDKGTSLGMPLIIAGVASFLVSILIPLFKLRALTKYENHRLVEKLYVTDFTRASITQTPDKLAEKLAESGFMQISQSTFSRTATQSNGKTTTTVTYRVHFYNEEKLAGVLQDLQVPPPKKKKHSSVEHDIYFVFVEDALDEAMRNSYTCLAHALPRTNLSHAPILITDDSVYFIKIGSTLNPYRAALAEALFLLGLM